MGDKGFTLSGDGWVQLSPLGEFGHKGAGVTQVIDREACDAIVADFAERKADPNFPGVLVDFDHFSLDTDKSSEAAGWISGLQARPDGLWAQVRWSDAGLASVTGGRFRLVSPVFPGVPACEDLGGGRIRPRALVSVALTNEPNIRGAKPIANRRTEVGDQRSEDGGKEGSTQGRGDAGQGGAEAAPQGAVMSGPKAVKFMWLLGQPAKGPHCGTCVERHGQVKTLLQWMRMDAPKCRCYCSLAEVGKDVPEGYDPGPVDMNATALENRGQPVSEVYTENRWSSAARAASSGSNWYAANLKRRLASAQQKAVVKASEASAYAASPSRSYREALASVQSSAGAYFDGRPVLTDLTDLPAPSGRASIRDGVPFQERQRFYEEQYRALWDRVASVSGSIEEWNGLVAAFGGAALAASGSPAPAGPASRAFGVGRNGPRTSRPRRGALSRAGAFAGRLGHKAVEMLYPDGRGAPVPPTTIAESKRAFREQYDRDREALVSRIKSVRGESADNGDLAGLGRSALRDVLRSLGVDPLSVTSVTEAPVSAPPAESKRAVFERLKARHGVDPSRLSPRPEPVTPADVRAHLADYLRETLGGRPGTVDYNLSALKDAAVKVRRALAGAREDLRFGLSDASNARRTFGPESREYARAVGKAEGYRQDVGHLARSLERYEAEYRGLSEALNAFDRGVREANPIDLGPRDADYNALYDAVRREFYRGGRALVNRWGRGWGDAARAASSGSNWVAANLKRKAAKAEKEAADEAASKSPYAASVRGFLSRAGAALNDTTVAPSRDGAPVSPYAASVRGFLSRAGAALNDTTVAPSRDGAPVTCRVCGEEGHFSRDCPTRGYDEYRAELSGKPSRKGKCYICGKEGHWAKECPERDAPLSAPRHTAAFAASSLPRPASRAPYRNEDGDLVVDDTLTIMAGTPPDKVDWMLREHAAGRLHDLAMESEQRIIAAAMRKARENDAYGGVTPLQRERLWRGVVDSWASGNGGVPVSAATLKALFAKASARRAKEKVK